MDKAKLISELMDSLQKMYDMERIAPLLELCQGEMRVLLYLDSHRNQGMEVCPSDLREALFVTKQRITTILASLRKKGYIFMEKSRTDRRRRQIILSEEGIRYVAEKRRFVEGYFDLLFQALGEDVMLELNRLVALTAEKLEGFAK